MGAIRKVLESFDSSGEQLEAERAAVQALADVGEAKAELFESQIEASLLGAGQGTSLTVPVSAVIRHLSQVRAYSSTESGNIGNQVTDILNTFLQGGQGVVDGIGKLISGTLGLFLGNSSGSTATTQEYYVATEGWSCVRVDVYAWYQEIQASSIRKKMEKVIAVVAVKSVVDLSKVKFLTFLNLYSQQLNAGGLEQKDIGKALDEARVIYNKFIEGDRTNALAASLENAPAIVQPPAHLALARMS